MLSEHILFGRKGEKLARLYLLNKGYTILEKNYVIKNLEIDIIAEKDDEIVFVEVKTRKSNEFVNPEDAVDTQKERNLLNASDLYMQKFELDLFYRIDLISIVLNDKEFTINHFENAGEWFEEPTRLE